MNSLSVLFLDWRGDAPADRWPNWTQRDVLASGKAGLPPGVRQSETQRDGRFCANSGAMALGHS